MSLSRREPSRFVSFLGLLLVFAAPGLNAQVNPLGGEFRVNKTTGTNKDVPKIAVAKGGTFQVAWGDQAFPGDIRFRRYDSAGAAIGNDVLVNQQTTGGDQDTPGIASLNTSGAFVVAWRTSYGAYAHNGISAKMYDSSGVAFGGPNFTDEFRVDTYTSSNNTHSTPGVGADSTGRFIIAWAGPISGASGGVIGQRFDSAGNALGGNFIVMTYTAMSGSASRAAVGTAPNGDFVVAWDMIGDSSTMNQYDIFARRYASSGAPLGAVFRVNSYTSDKQENAVIAMDSSGNFVVAWDNYSNNPIRARLFSSDGTPVGNDIQVSAGNVTSPSPTGVARFPSGEFVVSWGGPGFEISARLFTSTGAPNGSEFRVNTYTTYSQYKTSVGVDSAGNFTVVWASQANVGITSHEIFGQRYCPSLVSAGISLTSGSSNICPGLTAGTLTVSSVGGGTVGHQWGYRTVSGGATTSIGGQTGTTYVLNTGNTLPSGTLYIVCTSTASCGGTTLVSNEVVVFKGDVTAPAVTAPSNATTQQTLCQ